MSALTPNERKDLAAQGAKTLNDSLTELQRERRAHKAAAAAALMRRLRKLVQVTDAEAEGWKDEWSE